MPVSQGETDCSSEWGRMPDSSSRGRGSGLLGCGDHGDAKGGGGIDIYGFVCSCGCVDGAFVRVVSGSTATEPMIRSLVTQKAAPEAASGPAAFTIELGKPAVGGGAAGDVWVARKLLRRGSSGGVNSGSRHYHNFNLYCAGFGPFLAAAVAQAAGAAAGKWARYSRRSKPALTALVRSLTLTLSFPFCRFRRRCACV